MRLTTPLTSASPTPSGNSRPSTGTVVFANEQTMVLEEYFKSMQVSLDRNLSFLGHFEVERPGADHGLEPVEFAVAGRQFRLRVAMRSLEVIDAVRFAAECYGRKFALSEGSQFRLSFMDTRILDPGATRVFTIREGETLLGTVSMLFQSGPADVLRSGAGDSEKGFIRKWIRRQPAGSVSELSMFAGRGHEKGCRLVHMRALLALQYLYWRALPDSERPETVLITVHPRHTALYLTLGFRQLGSFWKYEGIRPAQTLFMEPSRACTRKRVERFLAAVLQNPGQIQRAEETVARWVSQHISSTADAELSSGGEALWVPPGKIPPSWKNN